MVSLKSILKLGNNLTKKEAAVQTEMVNFLPNLPVQGGTAGIPKIERVKLDSR
jgi:hypothetical protein